MSPKTPCAGCRNFHVGNDELTCDLGLLDWTQGTDPRVVDGVRKWIPVVRVRFPLKCDGFTVEVGK